MSNYDYEIMLRILTPPPASGTDWVRADLDKIRMKTPPENIARFTHIRDGAGAVKQPIWDAGGSPTLKSKAFSDHVQKLNEAGRSRLTLFAHGLPTLIAADLAKDGSAQGYTGHKMATLLKTWGLRNVTRISLIVCHGAVSKRLLSLPPAEQDGLFSFHFDDVMKDILKDADEKTKLEVTKLLKEKNLKDSPTDRSIRLLFGSLASELHKSLGGSPGPVRTEITARVAAMVTDAGGHNFVKFTTAWVNRFRKLELEDPLPLDYGYGVPWSKFRFFWGKNGAQQIESVYQATADDMEDFVVPFGTTKKDYLP